MIDTVKNLKQRIKELTDSLVAFPSTITTNMRLEELDNLKKKLAKKLSE